MTSDTELKSLIESTLLNDPRLSSQAISVTLRDGRATLAGAVRSYRRKLLAQQIVGSFTDVRTVQNNLCVEPSEPASDEEVANSVRSALYASADVTKETVRVSVVSGRATLEGTVGSVWEQAVADDIARGVRGVRDVVNLLVIDLAGKVGDEELANSIKAALGRATGLQETHLGVAVAGNLVTLSGRVAEAWQRDNAETVVRHFGLLHVRNEIDVTN